LFFSQYTSLLSWMVEADTPRILPPTEPAGLVWSAACRRF
jgi:hypothetical protein